MKVLSVFGTRPEAIKLAPVIRQLQKHPARVVCKVSVTAQHRREGSGGAKVVGSRGEFSSAPQHSCPSECEKVQEDRTPVATAPLAAFYTRTKAGHTAVGGHHGRPALGSHRREAVQRISKTLFEEVPTGMWIR